MNRRRLPHIGWWLLASVPLLLLAVSAPFAIDYYRAKRLEALVEVVGGTVEFERRGPDWLWDAAREYGVVDWLSFLRTRLTRVFLDGDSIDDEWLRNLVGYHSIEVLRLEKTKVTDQGLLALSSLPGLVALDLTGSDIHGSGLALLKDCPHLVTLVLDGCPIQSGMLDPKLMLPELEFFSVEDVAVTTVDCQFLSNSPQFFSLWLKEEPRSTTGWVNCCPSCPNLNGFHWSGRALPTRSFWSCRSWESFPASAFPIRQ